MKVFQPLFTGVAGAAVITNDFIPPSKAALEARIDTEGTALFQLLPRVDQGADWYRSTHANQTLQRRSSGTAATPFDLADDTKLRFAHPMDNGCSYAMGDLTFSVSDMPDQKIVNLDRFKDILFAAECEGDDIYLEFNTDITYQYAIINWDWINFQTENTIIALMDANDFPTCRSDHSGSESEEDEIIPFAVDHIVQDDETKSLRLRGKRLSMAEANMNLSLEIYIEDDEESCAVNAHKLEGRDNKDNENNKSKDHKNKNKNKNNGSGLDSWWKKVTDGAKNAWDNVVKSVQSWFSDFNEDVIETQLKKGFTIPINMPLNGDIINDFDDDSSYRMHAECLDCGATGAINLLVKIESLNLIEIATGQAKPSISMNVTMAEEMKFDSLFRINGYGRVPKSLAYQKAFKSVYIPGFKFSIGKIFSMKGIFSADMGMSIRYWSVAGEPSNGAVIQLGSKFAIPKDTHAGFKAEAGEPRRDTVSPPSEWTPRFDQSAAFISHPNANANVDLYTNFGVGAEFSILGMRADEAGIQFQMPAYRATVDPVSQGPSPACVDDEAFLQLSKKEKKTYVGVSGAVGAKIVAYYGRTEVENDHAGHNEEEEKKKEELYEGAEKYIEGFKWDEEPKKNKTGIEKMGTSKLGLVFPLYSFGKEISSDCVHAGMQMFDGILNTTDINRMIGKMTESKADDDDKEDKDKKKGGKMMMKRERKFKLVTRMFEESSPVVGGGDDDDDDGGIDGTTTTTSSTETVSSTMTTITTTTESSRWTKENTSSSPSATTTTETGI